MLCNIYMNYKHTFKAQVNWKLAEGDSTTNTRTFNRNHHVKIDNKNLNVSAAKMFRGDPSLYNPEDLLLSALASCHMMSYLYVCAQNNIEVLSYKDDAEAFLNVSQSGSGQFTKAVLKPIVTIRNKQNKALAMRLHTQANSLCFIANSCNFIIEHSCTVLISS